MLKRIGFVVCYFIAAIVVVPCSIQVFSPKLNLVATVFAKGSGAIKVTTFVDAHSLERSQQVFPIEKATGSFDLSVALPSNEIETATIEFLGFQEKAGISKARLELQDGSFLLGMKPARSEPSRKTSFVWTKPKFALRTVLSVIGAIIGTWVFGSALHKACYAGPVAVRRLRERLPRWAARWDVWAEANLNEIGLLDFRWKTAVLLFAYLGLFVSLTALRVHGSSMGFYASVLEAGTQKSGLLLGSPKSVRSDEYLFQSPAMFSQVSLKEPFALQNLNIGAERTAMLSNVAIKHVSSLFRPQLWGFFLFPRDMAFSFYWNAKAFGMLTGLFLIFMLVSGNHFWISWFGSVAFYFSPYIQWWFTNPPPMPEMVAAIGFLFVSILTILLSRSKKKIVVSTVIAAIAAINFALAFYPPSQVPLAWLLLVLLVGYAIHLGPLFVSRVKTNGAFRIVAILSLAIVCGAVLAKFVIDAMPTIRAVLNTAYPGHRISVGGGQTLGRLFSTWVDVFFNESRYIAAYSNISEASGILFVFPFALVLFAVHAFRTRRLNIFGVLLSIYILATLTWWMVGWPTWLAKLTMFSRVPESRVQLGLGLGSWVLFIFAMGRIATGSLKNEKPSPWLLLVAVPMVWIFVDLHLTLNGFLQKWEFWSAFFGAATLALLLARQRFVAFLATVAIVMVLKNFLVNPISRGFPYIDSSPLYKVARAELAQNPNGNWLVFGSAIPAQLLKIAGVSVIAGPYYLPPPEMIHALDPDRKFAEVHNRFAHANFFPQDAAAELKFNLVGPGSYNVLFPLRPDLLQALNAQYLVFHGDTEGKAQVPGFQVLLKGPRYVVLKRR